MLLPVLLLIFAPSWARAAVFTCDSGLSKGAFAAIVVESVVIVFLLWTILIMSIRRKVPKPDHQSEQKLTELKSAPLKRQPSQTSTIVESVISDLDTRQPLIPTLLLPRTPSMISPPSLRSSTLYAFETTPAQEVPEIRLPRNSVLLTTPAHMALPSSATLPNPYSEAGHGELDDDASFHDPSVDGHATNTEPYSDTSDTGAYRTPQPGPSSMGHSDSSWADNVVGEFERGPTPLSRQSTMSSYLNDSARVENIHGLLINRQRDSYIPGASADASRSGEHSNTYPPAAERQGSGETVTASS
ncbi:hypothetical protein WOLCODRAFT_164672 [Wolfiporia cocos MD-104 SS10]|uniref:Uncharacterized protein n=1 Tax=Wolfiporia cocos (strain MD-104) TaxID=742152 RepID=A0A2H3JNH1_WOLCO|nr:hypothetical protein WOLCODRAFT_164672 [Wolfiporia cocos MD-104 SS10]